MKAEMGQREDSAVAELQGLDGAFCFAERLLQRIWHRGDFDRSAAFTACGTRVRILAPGKWNRLGGPDFFNARLEIGGVRLTGDVEVHLRASDWNSHGHGSDPKYRHVVLHVVLFPPPFTHTVCTEGRNIPILALLPLLYRSLEEHADDDQVERLASHPLTRAQELLGSLPVEQLRPRVQAAAESRWLQKVHFASLRLKVLGWEQACHQTALEVLGYRFNRGPMLALAAEYPLEWWSARERTADIALLLDRQKERWAVQAIRPANQPRARLRQYSAWVVACPQWPGRLVDVGVKAATSFSTAPVGPADVRPSTQRIRKHAGLPDLHETLFTEVCGGAIGGTRFETLVCDAFWPLLAAHVPEKASAWAVLWHHWYVGDVPETIARMSAALGLTDGADWPCCHGGLQGLLALVWREQVLRDQTAAC